jgi:hypothetical protein
MRYKVQDNGEDHTPTYKQGVNKELWHKSSTTKVNSSAKLVDYSRGGHGGGGNRDT